MQLNINNVDVRLNDQLIVEHINLQVPSGYVIGLIGPNGSGKSTLLRTVYRMLRPQTGYVLLDDEDVWRMNARDVAQKTATVVQETPAEFDFTVLEVVQMGRTPHKRFFQGDDARDFQLAMSALERVSMAHATDRRYITLSGGEKQRVMIARALTQEPQLLILDEPTNHLDIHHQLDILQLITNLGVTTLITLHDLNLAATYCQSLYVLSEGKVVQHGSPESVLTRDLIRDVFKVDVIHTRHPKTNTVQLTFIPLE